MKTLFLLGVLLICSSCSDQKTEIERAAEASIEREPTGGISERPNTGENLLATHRLPAPGGYLLIINYVILSCPI